MKLFKNRECPDCTSCKYATQYIPHYTYPWHDPYCELGHGKCKVNKICKDYIQIGRLSR